MKSRSKGHNRNPDSNMNLRLGKENLESNQSEVMELLFEQREGLTTEEISEMKGIDPETIRECLLQLHRKDLIHAVDEQGKDGIWTTKYFLKAMEKNAVGLLSDSLVAAVLDRVVNTNRCTKEELLNLDIVQEESVSLLDELRTCGLIEIEGDEIILTKKGRKVLEHFEKLEEILE